MDNPVGLAEIGGMARISPGWRGGWTLQLYVLKLTVRPCLGTLLIVLPALLLERLLRLFALIADASVPADAVARLLLDLVPHYLGQALPAALFIGIHAVVSRLDADNELEAMQNAGLSLAWISRPFMLIGVLAAICGFALYGYLEPLSRYAYRAGLDVATEGGWNALIPAGQVTPISDNLVVEADRAEGGELRRVFIYQRLADGGETLSTGRSAQLQRGGGAVLLRVEDGARLEVAPDGGIATVTAPDTVSAQNFVLRLGSFAGRGLDERELTLGELWPAAGREDLPAARRRRESELHSRIIRALSFGVIPFFAVPFGLAAKRTSRAYGIVAGVLILVLYLHAVQLAAALGTAGLIDPRALLWAVFGVFSLGSVLLFRRANRHSGEGPLDRLFGAIDTAGTGAAAIVRRWRPGRRARPAG